MEKLPYKNIIPVAAHRGNAKYFPENTMVSFRSAASLNPDMIETDVHMTSDGKLIIMHDHMVDRTTDGKGLIREKTFSQIRKLDAGAWKDEKFRGEHVPEFEEMLDFFSAYPDMLYNIELKDYPANSGEFALKSADKTIALMKEYGILERSVINTWSGELNEYIAEKYGDEIRIHGYFPQEKMGSRQKRFVYDYAYCVCLFGTKDNPVVNKSYFDFCQKYHVEPWVFYPDDKEELYAKAIENGAMLFTSNNPEWTMNYLRAKGLHQ